jgi:hypothetical protein
MAGFTFKLEYEDADARNAVSAQVAFRVNYAAGGD